MSENNDVLCFSWDDLQCHFAVAQLLAHDCKQLLIFQTPEDPAY
jgi:uncharacterized protein YdeI (YjbR/CyaY-like superfamily)